MSVKKRSGVKGGERTCENVKGKMKERETCTNYCYRSLPLVLCRGYALLPNVQVVLFFKNLHYIKLSSSSSPLSPLLVSLLILVLQAKVQQGALKYHGRRRVATSAAHKVTSLSLPLFNLLLSVSPYLTTTFPLFIPFPSLFVSPFSFTVPNHHHH